MLRKCLFVLALLALVCIASQASAVGCGNSINRGFNNNRNLGLRQVVVGNQLVTVDAFGNVRNRQFINNRNLNRNNLSLNLGFGNRGLSDRLLFNDDLFIRF